MTNQRFLRLPYPKGLDGRSLCRWCQGALPKGRRSWCSQKCIDEYLVRSDPKVIRSKVFERDHGVCARCGADTEALRRQSKSGYQDWLHTHPEPNYLAPKEERQAWIRARCEAWRESERRQSELRAQGWPVGRSFWEADHILEVVNGGGGCDLSNLQTLCVLCHRKKTADLARQRAQARRQQSEAITSPCATPAGPN